MVLIELSGGRPALALTLQVGRILAAQVDDELLALARHDPGEHQPRRVGIGRGLEHRHRVGDQRRALDRIDDLDRHAALAGHPEQVVAAVDGDGAFAGLELLGRLGGRLDLHHLLLGELLEVAPAQFARDLVGGRHDGAGVAGMALHQLAGVLGIEQVVEALGRVLGLHQADVVGHGREVRALVDEGAVGIAHLGRDVLGDVDRHVRLQPALALPGDEVRGVGAVHHVAALDVARRLLGRGG